MSRFRSSIQHDRLLQKIANPGTELQHERRKNVLDHIDAHGFITIARAQELFGHASDSAANALLHNLMEEGVLERIAPATYARDTARETA